MAGPTTENRVLVILNGVIDALFKGGEDIAFAYLVATVPFFSIPVLGWLAKQAIYYLAHIVEMSGEKFADKLAIKIQTDGEGSGVLTATTALAIAQNSGDQGAIQKAVASAALAYKAAFNLDGWSTPK